MDTNPIRGFVRRHPALRQAVRRVRGRLPQRLGGIDPARLPGRRRFELDLPRRDDEHAPAPGPASLSLNTPGGLWVPQKLEQDGLAGFEPETLACFLATLDHAGPGAVLDAGANVGVYSLLAAAHSTRAVRAFEPTPRIAETARHVAAANGLRIEVAEMALGDHTGHASFTLSSTSDASNSLASGFRPEAGRIDVRVDTLSRWCERTRTVPAVVKIDTETTEPDVIAGGLEALREFRPWIFCEVLPGHGVEERLMELLRPLDYGWYQLGDEVPSPERPVIDGRIGDGSQRMWLFAPEPPSDALWEDTRAWRRALDVCHPAAVAHRG
ncbi:FkbM family methyltransferase [Nocardiopsis sp. HNM0947]|uniref:FkbM family methyltransferase n=1 Tax=Nocardiopsis coralli TaxID=2772213 RepID=A0ABR9PDC4_9ACTN|nr:FkbM family methyltransferase [Nocardiopsis coralli]MBE3001817.1 FkbM family methyltransferase [Nocardiopsis coralli]